MDSGYSKVNIVGAGLAGLSAAITLASQGVACRLLSAQPSERAQSVMAAGGINGALNTMGEDDCPENHYLDTCKAGVYIGDPEAIRGLTETAPEIIRWLAALGVSFNQNGSAIAQRNFGGQKKKRTAYARSSTGKIIMSALIDEARRYEAAGLITRYPHHAFVRLLIAEEAPGSRRCTGVRMRDEYTGAIADYDGPVILATGGINGVFPGMTTGTTTNSGEVTATVFAQGVRLGNLEMIQYHPTTIGIAGKRCLISEAARGEGGRLYVERGDEKWYFMEERYPELGNLMPRDVVAREMYQVVRDPACGDQVYLDMTHLTTEIWTDRLPDLRAEVQHYLGIDPAVTPIPLEPGIHYFMGGIDVDVHHRTNLTGLYAAGECCCQYHGANRLGGNSMLGAIYGGRVAAEDLAAHPIIISNYIEDTNENIGSSSPIMVQQLSQILLSALGIVRTENELTVAINKVTEWIPDAANPNERNRLLLALAMLQAAQIRKESRGAQYRSDYPQRDPEYQRQTISECLDGQVRTSFGPMVENPQEVQG